MMIIHCELVTSTVRCCVQITGELFETEGDVSEQLPRFAAACGPDETGKPSFNFDIADSAFLEKYQAALKELLGDCLRECSNEIPVEMATALKNAIA
jgi:hypothetical protein